MSSTRTTIRTEISRIPLAVRNGALKGIGAQITTPIQDIDKLTDWVIANYPNDYDRGIHMIKTAPSLNATVTTAPDPAINAQLDATSAVASRAENTALDALKIANDTRQDADNKIGSVNDALIAVNKTVGKVLSRLDKAESAIGTVSIDDDAIARAVNKVVLDAFAPFKQAVEQAGAQELVTDLASVFCVESKTAKDVFGVDVCDHKGNPVMVRIFNDPSAPAIDPHFIWTEKVLRHFLLADINTDNVWLGGEKGTGKSESVRQFCARTGRAFKRINFHKYTTCEDYAGATGLVNGETKFVKGDFLMGFTHPSTCILLDEVSNADAGELAVLNGFLEPNSAVNFGGSVHTRANGVLVFGADNTFGNGDDSGRYVGTRQMNPALMDRFAQVVTMEYLPIKDEIDAVMRHTGCNKVLAEHVIKCIRVARAKVQTADIVDAPSIRSVIAFIKSLKVLPVKDAWAVAVANRQPSESATALDAIFTASIDVALIIDNI